MTWTTEQPTVPGWYWLRTRGPSEVVVECGQLNSDMTVSMGGFHWDLPLDYKYFPPDSEWCGPFYPPEDAPCPA